MSRDVDSRSELSVHISQQIARLREELNRAQHRDQLIDDLQALMTAKASNEDALPDNEMMLEFMVQEALDGVDIARRYPDYFDHLLKDSRLQTAFLDLLDMMDPAPTKLSPQTDHDLSFLQTAVSPPPILKLHNTSWQAEWQVLRHTLQAIFNPNTSAVFRSSPSFLEDDYYILLHSEFPVNQSELNLVLEATRPVQSPNTLRLHLSVAAFSGPQPENMKAQIRWGGYVKTAVINKMGSAQFPNLPLVDIVDATGQGFTADLQLQVEAESGT